MSKHGDVTGCRQNLWGNSGRSQEGVRHGGGVTWEGGERGGEN